MLLATDCTTPSRRPPGGAEQEVAQDAGDAIVLGGRLGAAGAAPGSRGRLGAGPGALQQDLVGGFAVQGLVVLAGQRRGAQQGLAFRRRGRSDAAAGGGHPDALRGGGLALGIQQGHQGLAHGQFGDRGLDVQPGIGPHGLRGGLDGLLVAGGVGSQGVLHAVAQLA